MWEMLRYSHVQVPCKHRGNASSTSRCVRGPPRGRDTRANSSGMKFVMVIKIFFLPHDFSMRESGTWLKHVTKYYIKNTGEKDNSMDWGPRRGERGRDPSTNNPTKKKHLLHWFRYQKEKIGQSYRSVRADKAVRVIDSVVGFWGSFFYVKYEAS